jgi:hypothetical protein
MRKTKHIEGECQHCHGRLEFPVETIGLEFPCPHCGQGTELRLPKLPEEPTIPRRAIIWGLVAAFILLLGLVGSMIALKEAGKWARQKQETERPGSGAARTNWPAR